jgi:universal stress protein A
MSGKKILFATDYSEASEHAFQHATWLTQCTQAQLCIVHVSEREQYPVGELFDEEPEPNQKELERLQSILPEDSSISCEHRLLYGEAGSAEITKPFKVIVDFAKKENVDMIVLGTHGRSGVGHFLIGSVAESVVGHAHCPVVTVRQSKDSENASEEH